MAEGGARAGELQGQDMTACAEALHQQQKRLLEALLFVACEPLSEKRLAEYCGLRPAETAALLRELAADYQSGGFELVEIAGGWQFLTAEEFAPQIEKLYKPRARELSNAAMETLAIVAYRQPITKQEVEAVRQVSVDAVMSKLLERRLIKEVGRREGPGKPILYGTTREFLEYFGLNQLADLPPLEETREDWDADLFARHAQEGERQEEMLTEGA